MAVQTEKHKKIEEISVFDTIKTLLQSARKQVIQNVNTTMVRTYFEIGKVIVMHEQQGKEKAEYGAETLNHLSKELTKEFGKGFSATNLKQMRTFFLEYSKGQTVSDKSPKQRPVSLESKEFSVKSIKFSLSWSHYVFLMRLNERERTFYEREADANQWSLRELKRQFDSALLERISLSRNKKAVLSDSLKKYHAPEKPEDVIKDPYILEFLGLREDDSYTESELEQKIIDHLEHFLLEIGKGFSFVGRQQRFTFDEQHFFVDLVFYNRLLRCFVIIDLKLGKIKHQDLGQMQMCVNYYDRFVKTEEENPTIGIVLCKDKSDTLVEITLPKDNGQIFASKYELYLPTKEELRKKIEEV